MPQHIQVLLEKHVVLEAFGFNSEALELALLMEDSVNLNGLA